VPALWKAIYKRIAVGSWPEEKCKTLPVKNSDFTSQDQKKKIEMVITTYVPCSIIYDDLTRLIAY
jgi:hypothetical protein